MQPSPSTLTAPAALPAFSERALLVQMLCAAVPALALFATGRATAAGYCFWGVFAVVLLQLAIRSRWDELLGLVVASMPVINLLRAYAIYNIIIVLLLGVLAGFGIAQGATAARLWQKYSLAVALLVGTLGYYTLSLMFTLRYEVNLRLFELSLTVLCWVLIGRHRRLLTTTLLGFCLAAVLVGLGFVAQAPAATAGRLGMIFVEGRSLGNPAQLGLPLALSWLALVVDRGRWVGLERQTIWRWSLAAVVFVLLALTTSRAAWAVAVVGLMVSFVWGSRQRWQMLVVVAAVLGGVQLLQLTPLGDGFKRGLSRTFDDKRTLANRTSGRSDQWQVSYRALTESTGALIYGHGPGLGGEVYARVSQVTPGVRYAVGEKVALHSLFMQVAVETGLIGLGLLLIWLTVAGIKVVAWSFREKVAFPLACFLGYVIVVITVSGNDTTSATLLGMGILTTGRRDA